MIGAFGDAEAQVETCSRRRPWVVLTNAQAYGVPIEEQHLEQALVGREVIDMAKGIIMNATGCARHQDC